MKKKCPECGEVISGRADKRFCSDQCRSAFHNRVNGERTHFIRTVNSILRKNRRILELLNPEGKARVHKSRLLERGFKFSYFTNEYITKSGNVYRFCYEHGYLPLDNDYYTLVIRQEYVE